jgi:multidrug transporter EmrE-like cation transporter
MNVKKILGLLLVAAGVVILVYRGFTYTKETHKATIGPFDFKVKEKEHVEVPTWAGLGAVIAGVALLVVPLRRER